MSPNNIPAATSASPPKTSNRRALLGPKVGTAANGIALLAMGSKNASVTFTKASVRGRSFSCCLECRHHVFGEHMLRLNALPVIQTTEIRHDRQLADPAFRLQFLNLSNNFVGRADKFNFLIHDLVVGQLGQRLTCSACVVTITFRPYLRV